MTTSVPTRVLVTGAAGFLGGALARHLAGAGHPVRALVRRDAGTDALRAAGVEVALGDVRDQASLRTAVRGCTHVVHLAATKRGAASEVRDVNVRGTVNVAEAAAAEGAARLVYGSTLGVHGFVMGEVLTEDSPIRPNTAYRHSKWLGEERLREASARTGLPIVVARISSVIGPGARGWLPLVQGIAAGRMRLIGDGSNFIDLVQLDDLVDGLRRCAVAPGIEGRCYVLAGGAPPTLGGFASSIARALGAPTPQAGPYSLAYRSAQHMAAWLYRVTGIGSQRLHGREALVASKRASSARARAELGYAPAASVEPAIQAMVAGFVAGGHVSPARTAVAA